MEILETLIVSSPTVACDGGGGALGHPRVWLSMEKAHHVDCPYCGRRYVLAEDRAADAAESEKDGPGRAA